MSKPRLIVSLVIALGIVAASGWWAVRTFYLMAPAGPSTDVMVAYGYASPPGSDVPSVMVYMVKGDGHAGYAGVRTVGGVPIEGPVPISMPAPPYTPQAKKDKVEGAVLALVNVDASGNVAGVNLGAVSLSRNLRDGLDESVLETLPAWKFKPATERGKPVPVKVMVHVDFRLF